MNESESTIGARKWPEWDRDAQRVEMSLESDEKSVLIRVLYQDKEAGRLRARIEGKLLIIEEVFVPQTIEIKQRTGIFFKRRELPARKRGYGLLLIRSLLNFARKRGLAEIIGGVSEEDLKADRYMLEWYSRRGFIVERTPSAHVPGSITQIRLVL